MALGDVGTVGLGLGPRVVVGQLHHRVLARRELALKSNGDEALLARPALPSGELCRSPSFGTTT